MARPFFNDTIVRIAQEEVRGDVAIVVAVPDVLEGGGVVVNPAACPAGNARQPQRGTVITEVPIGAAACAKELAQQSKITGKRRSLVWRAYRLDQAAAGGVIQAAPVVGV